MLLSMAAVSRAPEIMEEPSLRSIPVGKATPVSDLTTFDAALICILYPYETHVDPNVALAERINAYLDGAKYTADEGHWSIVLAGKETIELVTFRRSRQLDILAKHEISTVVADMLPEHFSPKDCANGAKSALTKIEYRDRTYVVLGATD